MRSLRLWRPALVAVTLLLAACSNSEGEAEATVTADSLDPGEADATGAQDGAEQPDGSDGGDLSVEEVTEILFPSFDDFSGEEAQARYADEERERQLVVVECMAAQGFEYTPVDYGSFEGFGPLGDLDPTSREYAEEFGLGFTTFDGFDAEGADFAENEFVDPNFEYAESLSDGAREAYYEALYGTSPDFDSSMTEEEFDALFEENPELFGPQGCEGEGYEQASQFADTEKIYREFDDEFDALYERVQADPRVVAVETKWVDCMADKGHTYGGLDDMYQDIGERSNSLYDDFGAGPEEPLSEAEIDAMTEEELDGLFGPPEVDQELLAEIQDYEIAVAVDSWDCGGTVQFETFEDVFAEYQDDFIAEHIDGIRAALAGTG